MGDLFRSSHLRLTDPAGRHLAPTALDHLLCDPTAHAVVLDSLGRPLDVGRAVRFATGAQRRAMHRRDGGCTFPGCDAPPSWVDAHHVEGRSDLGGTDIANLASLCRYHHGVTHRRGWHMAPTADGWFTWTTPNGRTITSQRHGRRRPDP